MAVTPKGAPAWSRTADHTFYGGHTEKTNYLSQGTIDPLTDMSAEDVTRMASDLAAVVRVAPFAVLTLQMRDTIAADPVVEAANLMTGVASTSYDSDAVPPGFPVVTRIGDGHARITFSASYSDEYSQSSTFAPSHAVASALGTGDVTTTCVIVSSTVVDVYAFESASGSALQDAHVTVTVW